MSARRVMGGSVAPNNNVDAALQTMYVQDLGQGQKKVLWVKDTDGGNTGWVLFGRNVRCGEVTVGLLDTSKDVTFAVPMPDSVGANYRILFQPQGLVTVNLGYSNKAQTGFTLNLSVGVVATIDWVAVED